VLISQSFAALRQMITHEAKALQEVDPQKREKEGKTERKITCKVKRTRVVFFLGPTGLRICVRVNFSGALK
jgi:hypothetical protein